MEIVIHGTGLTFPKILLHCGDLCAQRNTPLFCNRLCYDVGLCVMPIRHYVGTLFSNFGRQDHPQIRVRVGEHSKPTEEMDTVLEMETTLSPREIADPNDACRIEHHAAFHLGISVGLTQ